MHLTAEVLSLSLVVLGVSSTAAKWREWLPVSTNISALSNFSPRSSRVASAVLCYAHASSLDEPANVACYKDHECHVAQVDTELAVHESSEWSCYQSPVRVSATGDEFMYRPQARDSPCEEYTYRANCTLQGIRRQLIGQEAPPLHEKCTIPFFKTEYGCVFTKNEDNATFCEARRACSLLGGDFASPRSLHDFRNLLAWILESAQLKDEYWIGAYYRDPSIGWQNYRDGKAIDGSNSTPSEAESIGDSNNQLCAKMKIKTENRYEIVGEGCCKIHTFICEVFL